MKKYLIGLLVLMILPLVSADIIDNTAPSVHSNIINLADFPDYTFVMVYEAPHVSRGPSFAKIIYENGYIPSTTRYGDSASLYAIETAKLEDNHLYELIFKIDDADFYNKDSLTNEAKQYLLDNGTIIIDYLTVSSTGYVGVVDVDYTLTGLENGNYTYTATRNGMDVIPDQGDDEDNDLDDGSKKYEPIRPSLFYPVLSLIALIIIGYILYKRKKGGK